MPARRWSNIRITTRIRVHALRVERDLQVRQVVRGRADDGLRARDAAFHEELVAPRVADVHGDAPASDDLDEAPVTVALQADDLLAEPVQLLHDAVAHVAQPANDDVPAHLIGHDRVPQLPALRAIEQRRAHVHQPPRHEEQPHHRREPHHRAPDRPRGERVHRLEEELPVHAMQRRLEVGERVARAREIPAMVRN
ncbi:MAG: hypothetical protein R3B70_03080 [Polyangiaceae bacterium]